HATQRNLQLGIKGEPMGFELENRCLGLIGFGATAKELARRARPFGMKIIAVDVREITFQEQQEFGLEFAGGADRTDKVIRESDYLSLHLHLNVQTRNILDARRLGLMKPSACLINVSRGALVDEQALYRALQEGRIAGAGLDVFSEQPVDQSNPLLRL